MGILKQLFFSKYKPDQEYKLSNAYIDKSIQLQGKNLSVVKREANQAKGVVLLAHPQKKEGKYFFEQLGHFDFYNQLGYHCYAFDFNGFGQSEDRDLLFANDIAAVIDLIQKEHPDLPLILHGISFGGSQIIVGAIERKQAVSKLIIENAVSSNLEYYKWRKRWVLYGVLTSVNTVFPQQNAHNIYTNTIKQLPNIPKLFIYGKKDVITPTFMGKELYAACNSEKTFVELNSEHLTSIKEFPDQYKSSIVQFLG